MTETQVYKCLQMDFSAHSFLFLCNILDTLLSCHCLSVSPKMMWIFVPPKAHSWNFLFLENYLLELKFLILHLKSPQITSVSWGFSEKKVKLPLFIKGFCQNSSFSMWRLHILWSSLQSKPTFPSKISALPEIVLLAVFLKCLLICLSSPCIFVENQTDLCAIFIIIQWYCPEMM